MKKIALLFLVLIFLFLFFQNFWTLKNSSNIELKEQKVFVKKIIDGDTIDTNIGRIRLLGINTPEKNHYYYNEAKNFLKLIENKSVILISDKKNIDKYGRKLRYIFFNNRFLNVEILENGLATLFMEHDLFYKNKLQKAEKLARDNKIGLWKKSQEKCFSCIKLKKLNPKKEFFILENYCDFDCELENWTVKDAANHFFVSKKIQANTEKTFFSKKNVWNDNGDRFYLRDDKGRLVEFYEY